MTVELIAHHPATGVPERYPLPLEAGGPECLVHLRCLSGASALHLALAVDGQIRRRLEVEVGGGEEVELKIGLDAGQALQAASNSWRMLTLASDDRFAPAPAFRPPPREQGLDLALVIDGTLRAFHGVGDGPAAPRSSPLFGVPEQRDLLIESLLTFVDALGTDDLRLEVVAFGDEPLADATANDLRPVYHLHPVRAEDRALRPATLDSALDALTRIPPTPGADFVDALADALAACHELRWRPAARKLLLVVGDSPGHSLLEPAPWGCDARARQHDVDVEALALHRRGIAIATLYCPPPRESVYEYFQPHLRAIFDHTRRHYQRLASLSDLAFDLSTFDPRAAAAACSGVDGWVARGAAYGELLQARTADGAPSQWLARPTPPRLAEKIERRPRRRQIPVAKAELPSSASDIEPEQPEGPEEISPASELEAAVAEDNPQESAETEEGSRGIPWGE